MTIAQTFETSGCGCDSHDLLAGLTSLGDALKAGLAVVRPMPCIEGVSLQNALGRVLAADVLAKSMMPPFENSAMDGYAVQMADFQGDGPWTFPVGDRIAAGDKTPGHFSANTSARIFTGAPIPRGADVVIMQEAAIVGEQGITFKDRPSPGQNIRRMGEDVLKGAVILAAGRRFDCREIAAAAAAGCDRVQVYKRPRVAVICTGNEIVRQGALRGDGAIYDVNGPMLRATIAQAGAELVSLLYVEDCPEQLAATLKDLSHKVDMIITTGGVSVGEEDHVPKAVMDAGGGICVAGVAIKPGKPVMLGHIGQAAYVGLPGNPVSALVTWTVLGAPMLAKLCGATKRVAQRRYVTPATQLRHRSGRCEYRPAKLVGRDAMGRDIVETRNRVHSAQLGPLVECDGLVLIPGDVDTLHPGDLLEFLTL